LLKVLSIDRRLENLADNTDYPSPERTSLARLIFLAR